MQFSCPKCGQSLAAPEGMFGQKGKCRFCGASIVSPVAEGAAATLPPAEVPVNPPQPPISSPPYTAPPPVPPYSAPPEQPYAAPSRGSGLAIVSLVLGVLGLISCGLTSLFGLICGIIAIGQTGRNSGRESGRSMAVAGTAVSSVFVLMIPALAAILFPVFARARDRAMETTCFNNVKKLSMGLVNYTNDYDGHLPPAANWSTAITPYVAQFGKSPQAYSCPAAATPARYRLNAATSGIRYSDLDYAPQTVMLFDAKPSVLPCGGPRDVRADHFSPHGKAAMFGFADAHVSLVPPRQVPASAWTPR